MLLSQTSLRTSSFAQFFTVLLLFIFVIAITYLTTRWIAKIQKGQMVGGDNIEIIETARISADKYIEIVRTGDKYLVLGIGKSEVHMLTELTKEELIFKDATKQTLDFSAVLDKVRSINKSNNEENM